MNHQEKLSYAISVKIMVSQVGIFRFHIVLGARDFSEK